MMPASISILHASWLLLVPAMTAAAFLSSPSITRNVPLQQSQQAPIRHHVESIHMTTAPPRKKHHVDGMECVEVVIDVPLVGPITILEATAESQEDLVNLALEESEMSDTCTGSTLLNAGDPYGAVLWPAASAIASYMMTNLTSSPHYNSKNQQKGRPLEGYSVLELGTGTGLVSIAASLGGAKNILATDYESVPLRLLEYAAQHLNPTEQQVTPVTTALLDLLCESTPLPYADLVVAADIMYEPKTGRAMARRAIEALRQGSRVLVGDSPGRAGRPAFLQELNALGIEANFVTVAGWTCSGDRHELICGKGSRSVSETPQELPIDLLDLDPATCWR